MLSWVPRLPTRPLEIEVMSESPRRNRDQAFSRKDQVFKMVALGTTIIRKDSSHPFERLVLDRSRPCPMGDSIPEEFGAIRPTIRSTSWRMSRT